MNTSIASLTFALGLSLLGVMPADAWEMKKAPLMTKWAADVKPDAPLPEYPRPQLVRTDWLNLNGIWEYQPAAADDKPPTGNKLSGEILVPFPVESALSGVMVHHDRLWYRRSFAVPPAWSGRRVMLNFGAVDFESEVFVNGTSVGIHKGGYLPFSFDVTPQLKGDGPQELIVRVFDPTNAGGQPRGKQTLRPGGIMYTPTTGIWQTVWLEPVAPGGVSSLKIVPDIDGSTVKITVNTLGDASDALIDVAVKNGQTIVNTTQTKAKQEVNLLVPQAKLWWPDAPFLYNLEITVTRQGKKIDQASSYFGMRKISIGEEQGIKKMFLNNVFIFEIGPLDQGFWPDGIYTAPTDDALKNDIQSMKDLGFNMVRKHIKVEPARWYYWTDKLGLLVWQDMPSANSYDKNVPPIDKPEFEAELKELVKTLWNAPSIIMWDLFNESQGQFDTPRLVGIVKALDASRLVNEASGGTYTGNGDINDIHSYPAPNCPNPSQTQALACGEYGGIGLIVPGHTWTPQGGGYTNVTGGKDLEELYGDFSNQLKTFRDERNLSAAVYTQITDVETELNGLMTYDRVLKADPARLSKANHFQYPVPTYQEIAPTSDIKPQTWKYTITTPPDGWSKAGFDDSAWKSGPGGFGTKETANTTVGTTWNTSDIWLRRTVKLGDLTPERIDHLILRDFHDDEVEIFLNGQRAYATTVYTTNYAYKPISKEAKAALKPNSDVQVGVHCHQIKGGQFIDVGLFEKVPGK